MTKLKLPLLSLDATGKLGKGITFSHRQGQTIAEKIAQPANPKTQAQLTQRAVFQACASSWHGLSPAQRATFESLGTAHHMTGYAYFLRICLEHSVLPATLYEYYNTGQDEWVAFYATYWAAQSFTPLVAHKFTKVKLLLYRLGDPGIITAGIRLTDSNGKPTGEDLCTGTTNGNTLPTAAPYEWREITFSTSAFADAGVKYAIVVRALDGVPLNRGIWRMDWSAPTYPRGNVIKTADSGTSWQLNLTWDLQFEEYGWPLF